MGFISDAFSAVTSLFGGGGNPLSSLISGGSDIASTIGSLVSSASSDLGNLISGAYSTVKNVVGSGVTSLLSTGNGILSEISSGIDKAASLVNDVVGPIQKEVNAVTDVVNKFNDQLVQPITRTITGLQNGVDSLINSFNTDLSKGLSGLVQLPAQLAADMNSTDAQLQRAIGELGVGNTDLVVKHLLPGLAGSIGGPITEIFKEIITPRANEQANAAFTDSVELTSANTNDEVYQKALAFEAHLKTLGGWWSVPLKLIWGAMKFIDLLSVQVEQVAEGVRQDARAATPVTLLGVAEATEAYRRGIIDKASFETELARHGFNPARQTALFDLAQFLYGPREAVELFYREIIDQPTFATLMSQNNLDSGQSGALLQLMLKILDPPDIAAAQARGYISEADALARFKYARVQPELAGLIQQLELDLIPPELMTRASGRVEARQMNWLPGSLQSEVPPDIATQYTRAQNEQGRAALDWLMHWDIPGPAWWVDAWFRGLVTETDLQAAFTARNIPPELWDTIKGVEEELPPVWLVPDIVAAGVWSKEKAVPQLMKLGFSVENATVLWEYGYTKSKASKAATAGELQKVSLGNAKTMFDDGLIDKNEYIAILHDHGYSTEAATLTAELYEFENVLAERKQLATGIIQDVKLGTLTETQAQSELFNLGLTDVEVGKYMLQLRTAMKEATKLPTTAELNKLLKDGYIDNTVWLETMSLLGYSEYWASKLILII